jgi:hypothetical protein
MTEIAYRCNKPSSCTGAVLAAPTSRRYTRLQSKYPESRAFLQRVHAAGGQSAHSVNATNLGGEFAHEFAKLLPFSHIIFHHPHLGMESMARHAALLGHFFREVVQDAILERRGVVHVSVGGRQAQDWRLREQAARHGLVLVQTSVRPSAPSSRRMVS